MRVYLSVAGDCKEAFLGGERGLELKEGLRQAGHQLLLGAVHEPDERRVIRNVRVPRAYLKVSDFIPDPRRRLSPTSGCSRALCQRGSFSVFSRLGPKPREPRPSLWLFWLWS